MAKVSTYLNFSNQTEEAFNYYKSIFGGDFIGSGIVRFGDMPQIEGAPVLSDSVKNLVMHVGLEILGGHFLMGSDAPEEMQFKIIKGNNYYIMLHTDSREQTNELFAKLSENGLIEQPLEDMFWGDYYGSCKDKFGIQWMLNFNKN